MLSAHRLCGVCVAVSLVVVYPDLASADSIGIRLKSSTRTVRVSTTEIAEGGAGGAGTISGRASSGPITHSQTVPTPPEIAQDFPALPANVGATGTAGMGRPPACPLQTED